MDLLRTNTEALAARSPRAAARLRIGEPDAALAIVSARDASPVLERHGTVVEDRCDPAAESRRLAASAPAGRLVILGLGSGYLLEALLAAGREVAAVVESDPSALAAVLRVRDLSAVLARVPVILLSDLEHPVDRICLKASAPNPTWHPRRLEADPPLQRLAEAWAGIPAPTRPPRVLVVTPLVGATFETARSTIGGIRAAGAQTSLVDFSPFVSGFDGLSLLPMPPERRHALMTRYSELMGSIVIEQASAWRPDLVLLLAQAPVGRRGLDQLRALGIVTAFWFVENHRVLPYWEQVAGGYDVFFAIQGEPFLERVRQAGAGKAVYLPTACDRRRHVPVALTPDERRLYGAAVSFAGSPYANRRRFFAALADQGLRLWGAAWRHTELAHLAVDGGRGFTLPEMIRIFAGSTINLNLHSGDDAVEDMDPVPDYVNPRTFEVAACGAFQLVDARWPLPELFTDQEMVTFRGLPDLRDQVQHFLAHDEDRMACATRARARVLADHTFDHRARRILRETLPPEQVAAAELSRHAPGRMPSPTPREAAGPS